MDPRRHTFERNKLAKRLRRLTGEAVADYRMIVPGDRVMVCLSGGKDSYGLLDVLLSLQAHAPEPFEIVAMHLDQAHPGYPADVLPRYLEERGVPFHIALQDTYSTVKRLVPEGQTMCSLCSRLRRGVIYRVAGELGATKIALGHHREDLLETLLLNMFFGGRLKGMSPKLVSDDGRHVVIRPLMYVAEADLAAHAEARAFPIIPCDLCGSQENLQRKQVKLMLAEWERRFPGRLDNMLHALQHVTPSHLADRTLFDFAGLAADGAADPDGDTAFDPPSFDPAPVATVPSAVPARPAAPDTSRRPFPVKVVAVG
jgi:tRNA 2-thiocytidine biosynthesis protein TtcA